MSRVNGEACWDFPDGTERAARDAATTIRGKYPDQAYEWEDLYQEALVWAAMHGATILRDLFDPEKEMPYVNWRMRQHLNKLVTRDAGFGIDSLDALAESGREV